MIALSIYSQSHQLLGFRHLAPNLEHVDHFLCSECHQVTITVLAKLNPFLSTTALCLECLTSHQVELL